MNFFHILEFLTLKLEFGLVFLIYVLLMMFLIYIFMTSIFSFTSLSVVKIVASGSFPDISNICAPFLLLFIILLFCGSRQLTWLGSHCRERGGQQFRLQFSSLRCNCKLISFSLYLYDSVISQKLGLSLKKEFVAFILCLSSFWHFSFTFW